jgi:AraC-like DNA-binding protein
MDQRPILKRRFFTRIIIAMITVINVCVLGYGIGIYFRFRDLLATEALQADKKIMTLIDYNAEKIIESVQNMAIGLFYSLDVQSILHSREDHDLGSLLDKLERIDDIARSNGSVISVALYNHKLNKMYYGPESSAFKDDGILKYLLTLRNLTRMKMVPRNLQFTSYQIAEERDVLTLCMYDPPKDSETIPDALIINIDAKWLFDSIDILRDSKGRSDLFVISAEGTTLHASATEGVQFRNLMDDSMFSGSSDIHQKVVYAQGQQSIITAVTPRGADFLLVKLRSSEELRSTYQKLLYSFLVFSALFMVFPLGATFIVSRRLYSPFNALVQSIHSQAPLKSAVGPDELQYLQRVFAESSLELKDMKGKEKANSAIVTSFLLKNLLADSESIDEPGWQTLKAQKLSIDFDRPLLLLFIVIRELRSRNLDFLKIGAQVRAVAAQALEAPFESVETALGELVLLVNVEKETDDCRRAIRSRLRAIIEGCNLLVKVDLTASLSGWIWEKITIAKEFQRCRNNVHYSYIWGLNTVIDNDDVLRHSEESFIFDILPFANKLRQIVMYGDSKEFGLYLHQIIERISRQRIENAISSCNQIIGTFLSALSLKHDVRYGESLRNIHDLRAQLEECRTATELEKSMTHAFGSNLRESNGNGYSKQMILVHAVKQYIAENSSDKNMFLQQIADVLKMNPTYLGRIFRSLTGSSVVEYLHSVRMEKAKELLLGTDLSVTEVMDKVGFENKSSFYRIFRGTFGISPKEFGIKYSLMSSTDRRNFTSEGPLVSCKQ